MRAFARLHPLLTYYLLAITISWGAIFVVVGPGGFLHTTASSPTFAMAGFSSLLVVGALVLDSTASSADGRFTSLVAYGVALWIVVVVVALADGETSRNPRR